MHVERGSLISQALISQHGSKVSIVQRPVTAQHAVISGWAEKRQMKGIHQKDILREAFILQDYQGVESHIYVYAKPEASLSFPSALKTVRTELKVSPTHSPSH